MGIRSDVGVAVKRSHPKFEEIQALSVLVGNHVRKLQAEDGVLFHLESVKWYMRKYEEIKDLYKLLKWDNDSHSEDYRVVEACFDSPEYNEGDSGAWFDNPWNLGRIVDVRLHIEE